VKKNLRLATLLALTLIFAVALSTSIIGGGPEKPPYPYEDLGTSVRLISTDWEVSRTAPQRGPLGMSPPTSGMQLLTQGFEEGIMPPTGWSVVVNNPAGSTWVIDGGNPYEGSYAASCFYDASYSGQQDEWIISPVLDLSTRTDYMVSFAWMMSYYWSVDPYDNYELELWISTDGGSNFSTKLWCEDDEGVFTNWTWYVESVDLSSYSTETNVKLGWRYYGYDGAQATIDAIVVDVPPIGRCCYGDPYAPDCADVTELECDGLGGDWSYGLNCTDDPCPIAGEGDNCLNPIPVSIPAALPYTDNMQTTCGRIDDYDATCLGSYDGGEDIIYELNVSTATCVNVTMDPLGTSWTGIALDDECPPGASCIAYSTNTGSGAHGFNDIDLDPGTYYIMVDTWPSPDCIPSFDLYIVECPPPPPNDECEDAIEMASGDTVSGTCIGATVDCPGDLDWNAVWYKFDLPYDCNDVFIDFCPTDGYIYQVGVILYDECPPDCPNYILREGYTWVDCGTGYNNPTIWWWGLPAGTYWFPVLANNTSYQPMDFSFTMTASECPPYCHAGGGCDEYIQNVTVGSINNTTTCNGYADYTSMCTNMYKGEGYPITITIGNSYSSDVGGLWVDWNQDFDFYDAGEQITLSGSPGYGPYTATITPPDDAVLGPTTLRARVQYGGTLDPCGTTTYGEVEDYCINVVNRAPDCYLDPAGPFYVLEGDVVSFAIYGTDPDDGEVVTIAGSGFPAGSFMTPSLPVSGPEPQLSVFVWATDPGDEGSYTVTFVVTDAGGAADTCEAEITVTRPNDPPVCVLVPPSPIENKTEGQVITFQVVGTDSDDGDTVTINTTGLPSGATMNPPLPVSGLSPQAASFNWDTDVGDAGFYTVTFIITDHRGGQTTCDMEIELKEQPPVPTSTNWGLILIILAVAGFFGYVIFRRVTA
jgi:hypothetical protein